MTPTNTRRRLRYGAKRRGFTLVEVAFSLVILGMMTIVFAACFPLAIRTATFSNNYSQATFLVQHKIDELKSVGMDKIDYADLYSLGLIDSAPTTSPYSFTAADNLTSFFPAGTTGTITVTSDPNVTLCSSASTCTVDDVTVAINWTGGGQANGSYSASTMIIKMTHR